MFASAFDFDTKMPSSCVAPGCRSGYVGNDNTRIHLFSFPDAEKYSDEGVWWINEVPLV